jgi:hypothetical protein
MNLRLTRFREVKSLAQLSPILQQQLAIAGTEWDGEELPPAARIAREGHVGYDDEGGPLYQPELWDVEDEHGATLYQLWTYAVSSGSIFRADTTESVGGFVHNFLEVDDDELHAALGRAIAAVQQAGVKACVAHMEY